MASIDYGSENVKVESTPSNRGNVTVTTISMDDSKTNNGQFSFSSNGVRISIPSGEDQSQQRRNINPEDEDSNEAELSKLHLQHQFEVSLRNKNKCPSSGNMSMEGNALMSQPERERPMSWEGELSDDEMFVDTHPDDTMSPCELQSSRDSIETLRNVTVKPESHRSESLIHSLDDNNVLDLKYTGGNSTLNSLHPHHRSLSMNRISVLTEAPSSSEIKRPISPQNLKIYATSEHSSNNQANQMNASQVGGANEAQNLAIKKENMHSSLIQNQVPELKCETTVMVDKLLSSLHGSPLMGRLPRVLSTDSAVHSMYTHSVYSSPSASPRASRQYTPSLSRNNSDASHSSCYSSEFSPTHSPVQGRQHAGVMYRESLDDDTESAGDERYHHHQGISRQQLINSPCPICGDKISGFHYGIFSCESCKGFFKRTVQNRKNYMCLRGGNCPVTVATRKKCPACRFDKCLNCGMKLEAIREDRTRGGRSTYHCSYSLSGASSTGSLLQPHPHPALRHATSLNSVNGPVSYGGRGDSSSRLAPDIPPLLQEIMDVEHLWQYNESDRLNKWSAGSSSSSASPASNPLLAASGITASNSSPDFLANLCNIADRRLYKIVKWCKSLPLFKNISIDDQICLLINSWCELLVLSCCYRGVATPGEVRVGTGRGVTLQQSAKLGLTPCIDRMLTFTDHLRRLRVDQYEYVALKVIVLLTSDASDLKETEKVRASQEKALAALQAYTSTHYPDTPAKFGELLLRIPELQKTCQFFMQVGKEMLNPAKKSKEGNDGPSFNLLMELLRGDH